MILISCVVPMYNSSKTIVRALESIKNQDFIGKLQIVIVDDGSSDDSVSLVENFITFNQDLWIDLLKKENGGVSSARNEGMRLAKGDYIAFLDSDDFWMADKLKLQCGTMSSNKNIDLLGCVADGNILKCYLGKKVDRIILLSPFKYTIKTRLITSTVFFKKSVYDSIGGFDVAMKYSEDMNYWLRIMEHYNCYLLNESLVKMEHNDNMKHAGGLSNKLWEMEKGELSNIKYVYNAGMINEIQYVTALTFSFLKYMKRRLF